MENIQISLAAARVNSNMTQAEVAEKMRVSKQTIVNWEKGTTTPDVDQARQLSELYQIPINNIFFSRNIKLNLINEEETA